MPREIVADRFRVIHLLGQGGMAQVFAAEDLELGQAVAIRVIRPELAASRHARELFKREVVLARQITHPNVCRIYDVFQHRGAGAAGERGASRDTPVLVMELVRGETLARHLAQSGPLAPAAALPVVDQLAGAIDAAHRSQVVHGDFKSGNVRLPGRRRRRGAGRRARGARVPARYQLTEFPAALAAALAGEAEAARNGNPEVLAAADLEEAAARTTAGGDAETAAAAALARARELFRRAGCRGGEAQALRSFAELANKAGEPRRGSSMPGLSRSSARWALPGALPWCSRTPGSSSGEGRTWVWRCSSSSARGPGSTRWATASTRLARSATWRWRQRPTAARRGAPLRGVRDRLRDWRQKGHGPPC